MGKGKKKLATKLVKELARERVGQPKPSHIEADRRRKAWDELCRKEMEEGVYGRQED